MADYRVTTAQLTDIAAAIRQKGGTNRLLQFPSGFCAAISALPAGGGGTDTSDATAGAADSLAGKTAYAGGVKLTGSYVPSGFQVQAGTLQATDAAYELMIEDLPFTPQGVVLMHRYGHNATYYVRNASTLLFGRGTPENTSNYALSWRSSSNGESRNQSAEFYVIWEDGLLILASDAWMKGPYTYVVWGS